MREREGKGKSNRGIIKDLSIIKREKFFHHSSFLSILANRNDSKTISGVI